VEIISEAHKQFLLTLVEAEVEFMLIDFLTKIAGVSFAEADSQKVFLQLNDKPIPVIHFQHLVANKIITGRPQDKADVDMLQKIQGFKNDT